MLVPYIAFSYRFTGRRAASSIDHLFLLHKQSKMNEFGIRTLLLLIYA
jgi:hypothetical protein